MTNGRHAGYALMQVDNDRVDMGIGAINRNYMLGGVHLSSTGCGVYILFQRLPIRGACSLKAPTKGPQRHHTASPIPPRRRQAKRSSLLTESPIGAP